MLMKIRNLYLIVTAVMFPLCIASRPLKPAAPQSQPKQVLMLEEAVNQHAVRIGGPAIPRRFDSSVPSDPHGKPQEPARRGLERWLRCTGNMSTLQTNAPALVAGFEAG